ncbi:hypothetical protein NB22_06675 [Limosilactobacillus fermentum NB-22]|uniref:Uncharacterized protein n=1 Tax=Limosilactobacillus fermentum NB-22 TaxID=1408443 RepID=A0A829LLR7_LIMFE|nr:hypothetical protein NB22_06675 [Limosilactobacillus fermentum NB-22]
MINFEVIIRIPVTSSLMVNQFFIQEKRENHEID